jgi:hypothetical protein
MAQTDWMAQYQDRQLGRIHMPGSHDAGTTLNYIDKTLFGTNSNSATQDLTIPEQLQAGCRFFDLRLKSHKKRVVAHHTTAGQGAYGTVSVDDILEEAAKFCRAHRTEVVIFRISHTSLTTNAHDIAKVSGGDQLHTGTGNLCTKTLGEIVSQGGGLVCILDEEKFGSVISQKDGIHSFKKYKTQPNDRGISTCGCYTGTHKLHDVVRNGLKGQYEHNEKHAGNLHDHLWQVYWQKTYINPFSTTGIERGTKKHAYYHRGEKVHGGTHSATQYMLKLMQGLARIPGKDFEVQKQVSHREGWRRNKVVTQQSVMFSTLGVRNYTLPNIFSYDFVNEDTNKQIIALNTQSLQSVPDESKSDEDESESS